MVDSSGALVIILLSYSFFLYWGVVAFRIINYTKEHSTFSQLCHIVSVEFICYMLIWKSLSFTVFSFLDILWVTVVWSQSRENILCSQPTEQSSQYTENVPKVVWKVKKLTCLPNSRYAYGTLSSRSYRRQISTD